MTTGKDEIAAQVAAAVGAAEGRKGAGRGGKAQRKKRGRFPFKVENGQLWREEETRGDDGTAKRRWLPFGSEVNVLARTRSAEGEDHGRLVEVLDGDGLRHTWAMPNALLAGSGEAIRAELLRLGFEPAPGAGRKWRDHLFEYLISADPDARARCVDRVGWHGSAFVLPDEVFAAEGAGDGERVFLQTAERLDHAFRQAGTLADWQSRVAALALGNSRLLLSLSAAFAAPLLALSGDEGFGLHLRGGSSAGKSTALTAAGSVWGGGGVRGYAQTWRATDNALESLAGMHSGALLCLDELGQIEPKAAGAAAYMLAQGKGKARAGREGQARRAVEWGLVYLSTGEISLADKIAEGGGRVAAGMQVRVIDLAADAGAGLGLFEELHGAPDAATFAGQIKAAAGECYGTACRAFLRGLTADLAGCRDRVGDLRRAFIAAAVPAGADGQVRRVADRFALVAVAGELATSLGVTGWPEGVAAEAAMRCLRDWLASRGGIGSAEVADARNRLRRAIEVDGHSRFLPWDHDSRTVLRTNALGYVRRPIRADGEEGGEVDPVPVFYLTASGMAELLAGLDRATVLEGLAAEGVIVRHTTKAGDPVLQKPHRVPFEGKTAIRLYEVDFRVLTGGGGDG